MEYHTFLFPLTVLITALSCRLPFTNFPIDDDFAIYTYRARFAKLGFKWKKDIQLIGNPFWKMPLLDLLYGNPEGRYPAFTQTSNDLSYVICRSSILRHLVVYTKFSSSPYSRTTLCILWNQS